MKIEKCPYCGMNLKEEFRKTTSFKYCYAKPRFFTMRLYLIIKELIRKKK